MTSVEVSVSIVLDEHQNVLWTWDDEWGVFALPMARRRVGDSGVETSEHAALRAAALALGVPVRLGARHQMEPTWLVSGRDFGPRRCNYDVHRAEPHPDFAARLRLREPYLWLPTYAALRDDYEPLSDSSKRIVAHLVGSGLLPGRAQHTSVVLIERKHGGQCQFLLRREPEWGYALPSKRRAAGESYAAAAERCAQEELGLAVPRDLKMGPECETVVTTRARSPRAEVETFYCHGLFPADLKPNAKLVSKEPLVWADAEAIASGEIGETANAGGTGTAPAGPVSPTVRTILQDTERIPWIDLSLRT